MGMKVQERHRDIQGYMQVQLGMPVSVKDILLEVFYGVTQKIIFLNTPFLPILMQKLYYNLTKRELL